MSYLTIVQRAANLLSLTAPTTVAGSTDQQVIQLGALANEEGQELAGRHDWQGLTAQATFITVATEAQPGAVPADWAKFIPNTFFNRTTRRELIGPITPQQWQAIQAQPALNRVFLSFRQREGAFMITPVPTAGETIAFEYISKNWAISPATVPQDSFTADADTTYLDERLIVLGVRWRFLSAKGLSYAEEMDTYDCQVQQAAGVDGGSTRLNITGRTVYNTFANIPEGNWPGP